ncbi:TauD/TfdA family dioxygenase [Azospirillum sp. sgz302134]
MGASSKKINEIQDDLRAQDFSVLHFEDVERDGLAVQLVELAATLGLGEPYVPDLYQSYEGVAYSSGFGLSDIGGPSAGADHPAFSQDTELDLHTDGTLEPIGVVRTTMLVCIQPAQSGGETVIERTSALLEGMDAAGRRVLEPLFDSRALRRHATVKERHSDGPVFATDGDGRIIGRYSVSPRDEWRYDDVPGLREARQLFETRLAEASGVRHAIRLTTGQALIMSNSRVSHARRRFQNAPGAPRHLMRGLFCRSL